MLELGHYNREREAPTEPVVMYQRWHQLLFLHAPIEPELVQRVITNGLTVDTFPNDEGKEMAWVSLALFTMSGIRPRFLPAVAGLSAFHEINFRTYVHLNGARPGVYFISLDAGNSLACMIAKTLFGLKYHPADIELDPLQEGPLPIQEIGELQTQNEGRAATQTVSYDLKRKGAESIGATITAEVAGEAQIAMPQSLEFFLLERYRFYGECHDRLTTGRVAHTPYQYRQAHPVECNENLSSSNNIPVENYAIGHFVQDVESRFFMPQLALADREEVKS